MKHIKARIIIAILLAAGITAAIKWYPPAYKYVHPAINYTISKNYDAATWYKRIIKGKAQEPKTVTSSAALAAPCNYQGVARHFGWYYSQETSKQVFNPGLVLEIGQNEPVHPVLSGKIAEIKSQENGYEVIIQHGQSLVSITRGLKKLNVKKGQQVDEETVLGKASDLVYIEIRGQEGPVNIEDMLRPKNSL
ncbi:MAG: peptidoglycan DD-metalloendopeptidase family protein [Chitinophagales bacterium]